MKPISLIVATCNKFGISFENRIPWKSMNDMIRFRTITHGSATIYGKNTFISIPDKYRSLTNRYNYIVSNTLTDDDINQLNKTKADTILCKSLNDAINLANENKNVLDIFICGGSRIYDEALDNLKISNYYFSIGKKEYVCDNFFSFVKVESIFDDPNYKCCYSEDSDFWYINVKKIEK